MMLAIAVTTFVSAAPRTAATAKLIAVPAGHRRRHLHLHHRLHHQVLPANLIVPRVILKDVLESK